MKKSITFLFSKEGVRVSKRLSKQTNQAALYVREKSDSVFVGFSRERSRGPVRGKSGPGKNK